jgi:hypothetical protein
VASATPPPATGTGSSSCCQRTSRGWRHVDILAIVAHNHAGPEQQRVGLGHTLNIGEPWIAGSVCTHLLISLPYAYGPALEICEWPDGHARVLAVQPISAAERAFTIDHGVEALEQRLEDTQAAFSDQRRASAV